MAQRKKATPATGIHTLRTDLGWLGLAFEGEVLTRLVLPLRTKKELLEALRARGGRGSSKPLPKALAVLDEALPAYFAGEPVDPAALDVPLFEQGTTPFRGQVYQALREVPRGTVITYGGLAARAGSPGAARGVGTAMARNLFPLIVPCHRVVGAQRSLGGYSGPGGVATKQALLLLEGWDGAIAATA